MIIGIDVGGTFTDLVAAEKNDTNFVKVPSTPDDPARGVVDALRALATRKNVGLDDLLGEIEVFIHGTTVATNTVIQRNGARIGLITTRGFRDLLELREGARDNRYVLRRGAPEPLIARPLRLEIDERVRADGSVERPLDSADLERAIVQLRSAGVDGVAVCFLHSYKNPLHENSVQTAIETSGWQPYVSLSHKIISRQGEFDRLSTAAVNAYVGPKLKTYLDQLSRELERNGINAPIFVMQSTGGVLPISDAGRRAVGAVTSGPAGGAMAGALFAQELGLEHLVTYDTGGTSTDICVIEHGAPVEQSRSDLSDFRIAAPAIEINPLGIGGGSIARVDAGGILAIGPDSAGAVPGSACFMRGGTRPTLTDANLVLGFIGANNFLGGQMTLSIEAAREAIAREIAAPLGATVEDAAWAMHVLASSQISEGVRLATVRRGKDPRDFALMSFGGAGGLHADEVAHELEIPRVIIPQMASVLSALGFLAADIRQDRERSVDRPLSDLGTDDLGALFAELEGDARRQLEATGMDVNEIRVLRQLECRYGRQVHSISVPVVSVDNPAAIEAVFTAHYRELYGHAHENEPAIVDLCRVSVFGTLPKITLPNLPEEEVSDPAAAQTGTRLIYMGRPIEARIYRFEDIRRGMRIIGPAIVESASTTILVGASRSASLDTTGSLRLEGAR